MRKSTPVHEYMSRLPEEIDRRETLGAAADRMAACDVRHIPVMDGASVCGVLSRADTLAAWIRYGQNARAVAVGEVCTRAPLQVSPVAPIGEVAARMLERGVTSALVSDGGVLVGIFTSTDALRVLAER
ncbi:MAG: CBS domain-containing protein [Myxococcales bacterium]|jgi:CBS domain-containing protein|nr:CBS domain-containing protein [Myxococcales bacterium]